MTSVVKSRSRRKLRGRMSRTAALVGALSLALAACGGGEDDPAAAPEEAAAEGEVAEGEATDAVDPALSDDPVAMGSEYTTEFCGEEEVDLLVWSSREYYIPLDEGAAFMEACPNINITWDVQSNDDILQQLQRMQDAGQTMPDIVHDDTFLLEAYKEFGLIQPITEQVERWEEEDPETYNELLPIVFEENEIDGEIWGVAVMANFDFYYYNPAMFEEAGIPDPQFETFEDVYDALLTLKENDPEAVPLTVQALAGEGVTMLKNLLYNAGTPFEGAVPDLTSEGAQYVLEWLIRATEAGLLPPEAISWGESEARGAFIRGDAGLIVDGLSTAGDFFEVPDFELEENWDTTMSPIETTEGGPSGNYMSAARTWMVSADAEHPYEASLVLRWLGSSEALMSVVYGGGVGPRNTEVLEDPALTEIWPFFDEQMREAFIASDPIPAGLNAGEVEAVLEQMFGEIVTGGATDAEELAERYQAQLEEL